MPTGPLISLCNGETHCQCCAAPVLDARRVSFFPSQLLSAPSPSFIIILFSLLHEHHQRIRCHFPHFAHCHDTQYLLGWSPMGYKPCFILVHVQQEESQFYKYKRSTEPNDAVQHIVAIFSFFPFLPRLALRLSASHISLASNRAVVDSLAARSLIYTRPPNIVRVTL